eukprot:3901313-Rhodomonas_salina.2
MYLFPDGLPPQPFVTTSSPMVLYQTQNQHQSARPSVSAGQRRALLSAAPCQSEIVLPVPSLCCCMREMR